MIDSKYKDQIKEGSVVRLPKIFDRNIEEKLSSQAHRTYVAKLAACRQFVDRHFLLSYGVPAYPICDILLSTEVAENKIITISSVSTELAIPSNILVRYLALAEAKGLVSLDSDKSDLEISLTAKGEQDLLTITNAISAVAFKLRPIDSMDR